MRKPRRAKAAATLPPEVLLQKAPLLLALKAMVRAGGYPVADYVFTALCVMGESGLTAETMKLIRAAVAELSREIAEGLPEMEHAYLRTRDPYYVLEAWEMCRLACVPLPLWVEMWIEEAMRSLRKSGQIAGFHPKKGARSAETQHDRHRADQDFAREVRSELDKLGGGKLGGGKLKAAVGAVAQRHGRTDSAIDKAFRRANRPFPSTRRR